MPDEYEPESVWRIANEFQEGEAIYCVEGTLSKLYPPKTTAHGQLQNGDLTDAEGVSLKITFADCPQSMTARNMLVRVECQPSQQHGLTGVKVKDDAQYGRCIWVTPSAKITYPNGAPAAAPAQGQRPPPRGGGQQRRPQTEPRQPQTPPNRPPVGRGAPPRQPPRDTPQTRGENQFEAIDRLLGCYLYTQALVNEKLMPTLPPDIDFSLAFEICQRATATVFVDVAKAGIAAKWNPSLKPRQFPLPPEDPHDWKQCYIEKDGSALNGKTLEQVSDEDLRKLHAFLDEKKSNTPFAECVYQAAQDRRVFAHERKPVDPDLDAPEQDDIPF